MCVGVVGAAAQEHDLPRRAQVVQEQVRQQEVAEMIDLKRRLEAIDRVRALADELQARIADQCPKRGAIGLPIARHKVADGLQRREIEELHLKRRSRRPSPYRVQTFAIALRVATRQHEVPVWMM